MNKKVLMILNNQKKSDYSDVNPDDYYIEDKFRDRRGREHYDNGRYAPMNYYDNELINNRSHRYLEEKYVSPKNDYEWPYVEPIYHDNYNNGREIHKPVNKIGFSIDGEMERLPNEIHNNYKSEADYKSMDEMQHRSGEYMNGYAKTGEYMPMTKQTAMEWTDHMENEDGTNGAHWSIEQTKQVMAQKGIQCDPIEFYVAINMMYSDYVNVAKKLGVNNIEFYSCMAKAFLDDKDAPEDKLSRYFEYVVK